jgi:glycosyltransferase involved in cell wall biosynthesis
VAFVAVSNGGFKGLKNGPELLRAFNWIRRQGHQATLILYGAGSGPGEEAESLARQQNIHSDIIFRGFVPHSEVLRCLREEADVLVHPSLQESFSMAIMEAMAHGLPVIGGKESGAVPEVVQDRRTGLLVDVRDYMDMANAMEKLLLDSELRLLLGREGYHVSQSKYSINCILNQYYSLYDQISALGDYT